MTIIDLAQIQFRRATAAEWVTANPILAAGEPGMETDTGVYKIGDGTTAWTSLAKLVSASTFNAKGDIIVATGDNIPARLAVGTNGQVLRADSTTATGLAWGESGGGTGILTPVIAAPVALSADHGPSVQVVASGFQVQDVGLAHKNTDWQVASDSGFATIIATSLADVSNLTTWLVSLPQNSTLHVRVRYRATNDVVSAYSTGVQFTTKASYFVRNNGLAWYETGAASPDTYKSIAADGTDGTAISGNTGYARQGTGLSVIPLAQAMMRRCVLKNDGSGVYYYLDCDDSTKIAGTWGGGAQTAWLRVHEGFNDPVRPIPGEATTGNAGLRALATVWSSIITYSKGDLVTAGGKLWVALSDANLNLIPSSGSSASTLTGSVGQVMVEIPRFYVYRTYTSGTKRHAFDILVDPSDIKPFPNLAAAFTSATTRTKDGLTFTVHPAFQKAGSERSHRYMSAYRGNSNGTVLQSVTGVTYSVSQTRSAFRNLARARNTGLVDPSGTANNVWSIRDWYLNAALQVLFLLEYRTFYAQAVLGGGNQAGADYAKTTGRSNVAVANASGAYNGSGVLVTPNPANDDDGVSYRGIEDFYGSAWDFTDGYNALGNGSAQTPHLSNTPAQFADDTATNYTSQAVLIPSASGAYISAYHDKDSFLPASVSGGSASTFATDGLWTGTAGITWYIAFVGGSADNGSVVGAVALHVGIGSSHSSASLGASLAR
jgi:hypothetical protein